MVCAARGHSGLSSDVWASAPEHARHGDCTCWSREAAAQSATGDATSSTAPGETAAGVCAGASAQSAANDAGTKSETRTDRTAEKATVDATTRKKYGCPAADEDDS